MNPNDMLELKKWAVVGASNKKKGFGYKIYRRLKKAGYTVYPITPNYETVDGDKAYKSVLDLPEQVDVAEFIVSKPIGLKVMEEVAEAGIKNIWLQPMTRSEEIVNIAKANDINVVESCVLYELKK